MNVAKLKARFKMPGKDVLAKGKAKSGRFKTSSGSRFVFFVGDEGTVLVYLKGNVVHNRQFVPDAGEQSLQELQATLATDTTAPVLVVVDTIDQSYVQQTMPPVSMLSIKKLIKRRLDRDFGANDIKGAIVLGREKSGRKDWNFLMVALEKSPQLALWLDFVMDLPNRFMGIYLVSVESEIIVGSLREAMGAPQEGGDASEWLFFVSHNKVGGFRQVILRGGRIIFTRMTQPISDSTPEVIAGNIEQEMLSTIEYMRRLSYNPQAGLDIYIIAADSIRTAIDPSKFQAKTVHMLTPYEMAQHLGIEGATQPTDQFGDVILAACIGRSRKHVLMLSTPQSTQFTRFYHIILFQRLLAALIGVGIVGYAGSLGYDMYILHGKNSELEEQKAGEHKKLDALRAELKNSNTDVEKTNDMIDLYRQLLQEKISPLPFIARVGTVIKLPMRLKAIEWSLPADAPVVTPTPGATEPIPPMTAILTLDAPWTGDMDALKMVLKKLLKNFKASFKGYDIAYTKLPAGFLETEKLEITVGETGQETKSATSTTGNTIEVQLTIKGDVIKASPGQMQ